MKTKDHVLRMLTQRQGEYISGAQLAEELYVTRTAIWKAINALRTQGYEIEAVTNKGYRLPMASDALCESRITSFLSSEPHPPIRVEQVVVSTNTMAAEWAASHPGKEQVFIANEQTAGRGRRGRSFCSLPDTGIYMSLLLYPDLTTEDASLLTALTAVCTSRTLEQLTGVCPSIKWVNDLFVDDRKVAGILTEGFTSLEDGTLDHVIIGIGINLFPPKDGFPRELTSIAGSVLPGAKSEPDLRNRICGELIRQICKCVDSLASDDKTLTSVKEYLDYYRSHSYLQNRTICIHNRSKGGSNLYGKALGLDDRFHLLVELEDGTRTALSSGEVSAAKY